MYFISPFDLNSPIIPFATAIFPCPAIPPKPRISPFLMSKFKPFNISPGISTHKSLISNNVSRSSWATFLASDEEFTFLPIIHSVISFTFVDFVATVFISCPSLKTVTLSDTAIISLSLWVIKIIAIPLADNFFIVSNKISASSSVKTAVGSSKTKSFVCSLSISRAISVNCL